MTETDDTAKIEGQKFRKALGSNIKKIREKRDIDRKDLERVLHIKSSGGLTQIENGDKGLPAWKIEKLEVFLHLPKGTLMVSREYTDEELEVMDAFMNAMGQKGGVWEVIKHVLEPLRKKKDTDTPTD